MYLIYLTANPIGGSDIPRDELPRVDVQPLMLALTRHAREYILRDGETKGQDHDAPDGCEGVERVFVTLRESEEGCDREEACASVDCNDAMIAVALATVFFGEGEAEPGNVDFVEHVKERTRLADKVVVAGYTDPDCSLGQSEALAMSRARAVRDSLVAGGLIVPVVAISRPLSCFSRNDSVARRVEVTALYGTPAERLGIAEGREAVEEMRELTLAIPETVQ